MMSITLYAWSDDILYFNNNEEVSGVIQHETADTVTMDIGVGTMQFPKADIRQIVYDQDNKPEKKISVREDSPGVKTPLTDTERYFQNALTAVRKKRAVVSRMNRDCDIVQKSIERIERELQPLYREYETLSTAAPSSKKSGTASDEKKQKVAIQSRAAMSAKIAGLQNELSLLQKEKEAKDASMGTAFAQYTAALRDVIMRYVACMKDPSLKNSPFLETVKANIAAYEKEFKRQAIPLVKSGANYSVMVKVNDTVEVPLLFDTGASFVCISRELARQSGISDKEEVRVIETELADGKKTKGTLVYLKSVEVGTMKREHVPAIILNIDKKSPSQGLLGMSYLEHFYFQLDAKRKLLLMEQFTGSEK